MPNKFNPMKTRFRATFAGTQLGAKRLGDIDAENEILLDVQITLEGEAKGHGVWLDREFCEAVAAAGNATGDVGLKVRYGHPAMCSDAIGTELGRAKNFRVVDVEREIDGEKITAAGVVADVHLLKSAHSAPQGDIAKHVLDTAAEDPSQFGQSIVFTYGDWIVKSADGARHSYAEEVVKPSTREDGSVDDKKYIKCLEEWNDKSADGKIYAVLGKLHGSDFTDTPAATDGIFSTGTLAEEAEQMLDEHPQIMEVLNAHPEKVVEFLERTNLLDKVETKRVSGLQAAKDKTIAELREIIAKHEEGLTAKDAEIAELKAAAPDPEATAKFAAEIESLKADIAEKSTALDAATAEIQQLKSKIGETEDALSKEKAAHQVDIERYREQVGASLKQPGTTTTAKPRMTNFAESVRVIG